MKKSILAVLVTLFAVFSANLASADVNVLVIGCSRDSGERHSGSDRFSQRPQLTPNSAPFSPTQVGTELRSILSGAGLGNVNVVVKDRYQYEPSADSWWGAYSYNLASWFHFPYPANVETQTRWPDLRGEGGTQWDYVVLIGDPYTMEYTPGLYTYGVAKIAEEVAKGSAETILLMNWPAGGSSSSVNHYKEVVYRTGRTGDIKVAPAALAWQSAGSPTGSTHPDRRGAYIAAASIYSRIYRQSAKVSSYSYNDSYADIANNTVNNAVGNQQYSGTFNFQNPYLMLNDTRRDVHWSERGTSTEYGFKLKLRTALQRARVSWVEDYCGKYSSNTPEDDGMGWPTGRAMPIAFNFGRDGLWSEDTKSYVVNPSYWQQAFGFYYQASYWPQDRQEANDCFIGFMQTQDNDLANRMIRQGSSARNLPVRTLWASIHQVLPAEGPRRDSTHLHYYEDEAVGTYMYTLYSGRCPLDPKPESFDPSWESQRVGYETAWRLGRCGTRAPGFKVMPSEATATDVTPQGAQTLSVQFIFAPKANVTVSVGVNNTAQGAVSPSTLTFTPSNYDQPQTVTVTGNSENVGRFPFNVVLTTTSSDDAYDGLSDSWEFVNVGSTQIAPVANDQSLITTQDTAVAFVLDATDANGDTLSYSVVSPPANGTLSGTAPNLTYTPDAGFMSSDSFTYKVNDGSEDSNVATVSITVNGVRNPDNPSSTVNGLDWERYLGTWSALPDFDALTVDDSGTTTVFDLGLGEPYDNFGYRFTGYIDVPAEGQYIFSTISDDGSKLYIGSIEVVDNDGLHGRVEQSGQVGLKAGKHAITVTYFEQGAGNSIDVYWSGPGLAKEEIPADVLYRETGAGETVYALTVNNGSGDGSYPEGDTVSITADTPPSGQVFDAWTGDVSGVASVNGSSTTITMPASAATVTATYKDAPPVRTAINCGGGAFTATDGTAYVADQYVAGGGTYTTGDAISGTEDDTVYQSQRYGSFAYSIPVANGTYDVLLNLCETFQTADGRRIFDVVIEGVTVVDDLDLYATVGHDVAYDVLVSGVTVSDGALTITGSASVDNLAISGFRIMSSGVTSAPVAANDSVITDQDTAVAVVLSATDADGDTLSYSVVSQPANGTLSGTAPNLIYTPDVGFFGSDSFTFKANDGTADSNIGTISITVNEVVTLYALTVNSGSGDGSYPQGDVVTITASTPPSGQVFDAWTGDISSVANVSSSSTTITMPGSAVTVTAAYKDAPAVSTAVNCGGGAYTAADGTAYVADQYVSGGSTYSTGDAIAGTTDDTVYQSERYGAFTYSVTVPNGTYDVLLQFAEIYAKADGSRVLDVVIEGATVVDDLDIHSAVGHDAAHDVLVSGVTVSDGALTITASASVDNPKLSAFRILSAGVERAPIAANDSVITDLDTAVAVVLSATDADGDTLGYSVVSQPANGTLSGTAPNLVYTPDAGFSGTDSFTFKANDGTADSNVGTISITVNEVAVLRNPENPTDVVNGIDWERYLGTWSALPDFDAMTADDSGTTSSVALGLGEPADNYGYRFTGYIDVPVDGTYTFYTSSDDGSKLYIGTTEVVNNDGLHAAREMSGEIGLKAGKHAVTVTFFEKTGGNVIDAYWSGPGLAKQEIPADVLYRNDTETSDPWTPAEIATALWLDASDSATVVAGGGSVSQWNDKSGNGRNATQGTVSAQPVVGSMNGKSALSFDGASQFLDVDLDFLAGVSHSAFVVTKTTAYRNIYGAANGSAGASSLHVGFSNAMQYRMNYWANDWYGNVSANFDADSANILNYVWIPGAAKEIFANGASEGTGGTAGTIAAMAGGGRIGNVVGQGLYGGDIAEIIMITGTVTLEERQKIEGYLAHKWGTSASLPADHPYKVEAPAGAAAPDTSADGGVETVAMAQPETVAQELCSDIVLLPGMNLVALPLSPAETNAALVFGTTEVYELDADGLYVPAETVEAGRGYWVNSEETVELSIPGSIPSHSTIELQSGWNLFGLKGIDNPAGVAIADLNGGELLLEGGIRAWDSEAQAYQDIEVMVPGEGYSVYCAEPLIINLP